MGTSVEQSSPWRGPIQQKSLAIARDFWNTNSLGLTPFCTGAHDQFYFFHNVFPTDNFTKTLEITLKMSEITVRGRKSLLSVEEIHGPHCCESTLVQVMAWCCQAISHHLKQ